ncbi:Uncharacterised protein [Mycobacterium tuberculosis]|nr:Uncharacterised protein [Mycobacterium tuberculosis]CEZ34041.1 Uncharacterised protein [Mycobacterium tuberculosis]CEZ38119.1 Uncharacterised protein [Mycobacterium tuberculosis]CEZ75313.1 Uncharacterised protein [Mycobacterium tuberculosis]CFB04956.1 Uncharacterised protein [Mycobacterium tuberculosis]
MPGRFSEVMVIILYVAITSPERDTSNTRQP